jgi:hypothetical protein
MLHALQPMPMAVYCAVQRRQFQLGRQGPLVEHVCIMTSAESMRAGGGAECTGRTWCVTCSGVLLCNDSQ